jgi:hypothetical protein
MMQNGTIKNIRPKTGALAIDDMMFNQWLRTNGLYDWWTFPHGK